MSRSLWALTRQHAPAGADRPGRTERGSCSLVVVASSARQYLLMVLVMAGLAGLAVVPSSALAASGSHADHAAGGVSASARPHRLMVLAFGSGYGSPTGSRRVRALQHRLARAGFVPGPFDGRYGQLTRAAVMRFQAARGLVVDGIAGPITLGVLGIHGRVLYPGSGYSGNGLTRVRGLQRRLRRAGFSPGPVDGRYGPLTEAAVARFQAAHGLTASGIAGPVTLARLVREHARHGNPAAGHAHHPARTGHKQPSTAKPTGTAKHTPSTQHAHAGTHKAPASSQPSSNPTPSTSSSSSSSPSIGLVLLILALGVLLGVAGSWLVHGSRGSGPREGDHADTVTGPADAADHPDTVTGPADAADHPDAVTGPADAADEPATVPARDAEPVAVPARDEEPATVPARDEEPATVPARDEEPVIVPARGDVPVAVPVGLTRGQTMTQELDAPAGMETGPEWMDDSDRAFAHAAWLSEHGDQAGAVTAYERADELGHVGAAVNLGVLSEELGDVASADQWYRRADQVGDPNGSFNLAVLLWEQGRADEAKAAFERADRLGHTAAPTNLGVILEEHGNAKAAQECYRRADERGDAHGTFNLAALLEETGDHVGALRAYRRASRRGNPEIAEMARAAAADLSRLTTSPATPRPDAGANGRGS